MSSLKEIYEAMGFKAFEENGETYVEMNSARVAKPIDIVVRVYPSEMIMDTSKAEELILKLDVVTKPTTTYSKLGWGTSIDTHDWKNEIELPISQIRLYKETDK